MNSKSAAGHFDTHARPLTSIQVAWFSYRLASALKAGISPAEALEMICAEDPSFSGVSGEVVCDLDKGLRIHEAISKTGIFPSYFVNMVKIGEATGTLDRVMESLAQYYEREDYLNKEIKSALTYPLVLICLVAAVMLVVTWQILPIFEDILISLGVEMPTVARLLMLAGCFVGENLLQFVVAIVVIVIAVWTYSLTDVGKMRIEKWKAHTGMFDHLFQKAYAAKVGSSMSYAVGSGMSVDSALEMAAETVGNDHVAEKIEWCRAQIEQGKDLAEAMRLTQVFPDEFIHAMQIGLKTGDLPHVTMKISEIYEDEVSRTLEGMISAVEPTLVAVLSVIIGIVLITVMIPLTRIMASMG